ncbi:MAG: hypothetical protein KIS89_05175 [Dokdonella sp.]|nr:hypothetical protein [Dokdonella sp.]
MRALVPGLVGRDHSLPLQIPRAWSASQPPLDQVADAVIALHAQREQIPALQP